MKNLKIINQFNNFTLKLSVVIIPITFLLCQNTVKAQSDTARQTDVNAPLHLLKPAYPVPYKKPDIQEITGILNRIYNYLNSVTPAKIVNKNTGKEIIDFSNYDSLAIFAQGDFRLLSYEWGVTYAGMLLAGEVTGDNKFTGYTDERLKFISKLFQYYVKQSENIPNLNIPIRSVLNPHMLDDAGSICAGMIKSKLKGAGGNLQPMIDNFMNFISTKEYRFPDGTLARKGPHPNTLWLDDLFMSVPALAWMGKLTGEMKYFDDAAKQVIQFSKRMFINDKGLFMHGWVKDMEVHPEFHWARANGWAIMAIVELMEVLPQDHPYRSEILKILQAHIRGLAKYQSSHGFWHQLLDKPDSYLETSATAIYTYAIARSINRGYVDARTFGPMVVLAWNALITKVNAQGQVEGTCVGTGMGFEPAFYYYRPTSKFAAHGYGPTLLAGAEMISLLRNFNVTYDGMSIQVYNK